VFALATAPQSGARSLADALYQPGLKDKLSFALGFVFPSYEYMRSRYRVQHRAQLPWYYMRRGVDISRQIARSLFAAAKHSFRR
jgi:hypothetical protein